MRGLLIDLDAAYELDPRVSLRPEPFGALAYHFDNRRLSFLRSPEIVEVVKSLHEHGSVRGALDSAGIPPSRWPSFLTALERLSASDMIRARHDEETTDVA